VLTLIGRRLNERYLLEQKIGDGGMATVFKGKDVILDRYVAVKVLRSEYGNDAEFIRRFHREAHAATSLAHNNIVNVYDAGEDEEVNYIVMELVEGKTLKEYIEENKPLSFEKVIHIMTQLTDGIAHAHDNNIIHRDIKPQNILIDEEGIVKVTDFGIALASTSYTITHTNSVLGSVHYLSPEQARGGVVDEKSDVYSLGVVLYELVTGKVPYSGDSPVSVAIKHLQGEIPSPRKWNPALPQSFENIILKAMAKEPKHRYRSVKEMQVDIETALLESRKNERRFVVPVDEDQQTRVLPNLNKEIQSKRKSKETKPVKQKNRKALAIFPIIFFLVFSIVLAGIVFPKLFSVNDVVVPEVVGMNEEQAKIVLDKRDLNIKKQEVYDNTVPAGEIISQEPNADSSVKEGSTIKIKVSVGKKPIILENYIGESKLNLEENLKQLGINYKFIPQENEDYGENIIFDQEPGFGEKFTIETDELLLYVSSGQSNTIKLANLIGLSQSKVYEYIYNENLSIIHQEEYSDTVEIGHVIAQSPEFGTEVEQGTEVEVIFSKGPEPKKPITFTDEIAISVPSDEGEYEVKISYSDANNSNQIFVSEKISNSKTYNLTLTINPNSTASYIVYINGNLDREIKYNYDDVSQR
jgi:eukaryotic-like serine/threonine-protein kinase